MQLVILDRSGERRYLTDELDAVGLGDLGEDVDGDSREEPSEVVLAMDRGPGWWVYATTRRNGVDLDLVLQDLESRTERVIYARGGHVSEARVVMHHGSSQLSNWSAAVTVFTGEGFASNLYLIDDEQELLLSDPADQALYTAAVVEPGGAAVITATNAGSDFLEVRRITRDRAHHTLVAVPHADVTASVSPDGRIIAALINRRGHVAIHLHDSSGCLLRALPLPSAGGAEVLWSANSRWLALSLSSPESPSELYLVDCLDFTVELVVSVRAEERLEKRFPSALPEFALVPARDGEFIPCHVYAGWSSSSRPRPVIIELHGGPESQAYPEWDPLKQILVHHGFTVVAPDVRGSTGYGKRWYELDDRRLRKNAISDVADIHAWLPNVGGDPNRVALLGASYGGYLALASNAFFPDLWAGCVSLMGMSNLVSFIEQTAPFRKSVQEGEFGRLDDDREFLTSASPLSHVDMMSAPLLLMHGARDVRVPLGESQVIAAALQRRGVPCEIAVFPDEGHRLSRHGNKIDAYEQIVSFLTRVTMPIKN